MDTESRLTISTLWGTCLAALMMHLGAGFMDE